MFSLKQLLHSATSNLKKLRFLFQFTTYVRQKTRFLAQLNCQVSARKYEFCVSLKSWLVFRIPSAQGWKGRILEALVTQKKFPPKRLKIITEKRKKKYCKQGLDHGGYLWRWALDGGQGPQQVRNQTRALSVMNGTTQVRTTGPFLTIRDWWMSW